MRRCARTCPLCSVRLTGKPGLPHSKELDHIIPVSVGGTHTIGNVRIICRQCNQRRPKDGSDYSGPVTLWAQGEVPVKRPDRRHDRPDMVIPTGATCRKGLHPWIPENIRQNGCKRQCRLCREANGRARPLQLCAACGKPFPAPGRQLMCAPCVEAAACRAAELHASGMTWAQVAPLVGYDTPEGARYAAKRIGYVPVLKQAKPPVPRPARLCGCGSVLPGSLRLCADCVQARALRAAEMRESGHTLWQIAAELGYTSISSVTNLMNTVTTVETRMGRPRKVA